MTRIRTIEELREAIRDLEHQNYVNEQQMRSRIAVITERLKPVNIVKSLFSHLFSRSQEPKTALLKIIGGIATSWLLKKFFKKSLAGK
jgi:hypothetical protein